MRHAPDTPAGGTPGTLGVLDSAGIEAGSAWQRRPSWAAWFAVWLSAAARPRRLAASLAPERGNSAWLGRVNVLVVSVVWPIAMLASVEFEALQVRLVRFGIDTDVSEMVAPAAFVAASVGLAFAYLLVGRVVASRLSRAGPGMGAAVAAHASCVWVFVCAVVVASAMAYNAHDAVRWHWFSGRIGGGSGVGAALHVWMDLTLFWCAPVGLAWSVVLLVYGSLRARRPAAPGRARRERARSAVGFTCEVCGYALGDFALDAVCPECAAPVARSLPDRRRGSAWQRRMSPVSWVATNFALLTTPGAVWRETRFEASRSAWLLAANSAAGAVYAGAMVFLIALMIEGTGTTPVSEFLTVAAMVAFVAWLTAAGAVAFSLVCWSVVHRLALWRVGSASPRVMMAAVGHASVAWLAPGALFMFSALSLALAKSRFSDAGIFGSDSAFFFSLPAWYVMSHTAGVALASMGSQLLFAWLLWHGASAMRHTNPPDRESRRRRPEAA